MLCATAGSPKPDAEMKMPRGLAASHQPYEVLRDLGNADPIRVPLHLHQIELTVDHDHAVDLLDDAFARVPGDVERLLDCDAV